MTNQQIAAVFQQLGDLMEIKGENAFRIRAFLRAAEAVHNLPDAAATMLVSGKLKDVPGIGSGTATRIRQIIETGTCDDLQQLLQTLPKGLLDMMKVGGMGPKTVKLVYDELGVTSVDELEAAAKAGHVAELPRMGQRSQEKLLKAIAAYRRRIGRVLLGEALPQGEQVIAQLRGSPAIQRIHLAGSTRRRKETIGDLDVLVATTKSEQVMSRFVALPQVSEVIVRGDTKCSVKLDTGLQVDLRAVLPESYGAALHYFTGSQLHNIAIRDRAKRRGLRVNEYGVYREADNQRLCGETEEEVFDAVGLAFIPPELRENHGEIEAAEQRCLPDLITEHDLRGDLHVHTSDSDGRSSPLKMIEAAVAAGMQYVAITDHSSAQILANGLDKKRLREQMDRIGALEQQVGQIRILRGVEVDILSDGSLDLDHDLLRSLDWVVASVHTGLDMQAAPMTARIQKALETGLVDCLAHPTGRLLGERDPYAVEIEHVMDTAARLNVALELNCHYQRLDLDATHCRQARDRGIKIVINSDAHTATQLARREYGIYTARRGWLRPEDVLNAGPLDAIEQRRRDRLRAKS